MQDSIITVISLQNARFEAPNISHELVQVLEKALSQKEKILIFYSRRGNARAWICADCGHYEKCRHCDIALAYHTTPQKCLMCHHCGHKQPFPVVCPKCDGSKIEKVGVGIQQVEENLKKILGESIEILRIDSDTKEKTERLYHQINSSDIILTTQTGSSIVHPEIKHIVYLLFELNLSLPSYHIEEDIYNEISYQKKQKLPIYIQTYTPDHPLIQEVIDGNMKSFISYISRERKDFDYPPFAELATIRIHDEQKKKVEDIMRKLVNKIGILKKDTTFFAFDTDLYERSHGEWQQKIILKDQKLDYLISQLEIEIIRNRSVTLEWN